MSLSLRSSLTPEELSLLPRLLDVLFSGISIGSVLLIAALGLAIVFGLMGVINMAHGEIMMLGAYTTFVVQNSFKPLGQPWMGLYIFVALVAAFVVTALFGLILERGVIRYLYGRPLETLLATWGVSLILQQFVRSVSWQLVIGLAIAGGLFFGLWWLAARHPQFQRFRTSILMITTALAVTLALTSSNFLEDTYGLAITQPWFGAQNVDVTAPSWLRGGLSIGGTQLSYARMFIIGLTIVCLLAVFWFLNRTLWGLRMRAVTQNRSMSACLGIPTRQVDALTFALGSGLAGLAGCAVSLLGSVGPNTGQNYIVDTFMVVVVGGVGKLTGSIVAALMIGVANYLVIMGSSTLAEVFAGNQALVEVFRFFSTISMAKVIVFALIVAFLQIRPGGLFPQKGRTVDA